CGARTALFVAPDASAALDAYVPPHDASVRLDAGLDATRIDASFDAGVDASLCVPAGYSPTSTYEFGSPSATHPTWVVTGDFDHDGDVDFAAAGAPDDIVAVYANHGDGTFADAVPYASGPWPNELVA